MFRRWMDNVGRFDKDVAQYVKARQSNACYNDVPSGGESNNVPKNCFFVRSGKRVEAIPGDIAPFYAKINGRNIGYKDMLKDGWSLVDDVGRDIPEGEVNSVSTIVKKSRSFRNDA